MLHPGYEERDNNSVGTGSCFNLKQIDRGTTDWFKNHVQTIRYFCDSVVFSSCTVDESTGPGAPAAVSTNATDATHGNANTTTGASGSSSVWGNFEVYLELPLTLVVVITTLTSYSLMLLVLHKHKKTMSRHSKPKANQVSPVMEGKGSGRSHTVVQVVLASDEKGREDVTAREASKGVVDTSVPVTTINVMEANERKETTGKVVKIEDYKNPVVQMPLEEGSLVQEAGSVVTDDNQRTAFIAADDDNCEVGLIENPKINHNDDIGDTSALKEISVESSLTWHHAEISSLYDRPEDETKTNLGVFDVANSSDNITISSTTGSSLAVKNTAKAEMSSARVPHGVNFPSTSNVDIPSSRACRDVSKTLPAADKVQSIDNEVATPLLSPNTSRLTSSLSSIKSTVAVPLTSMSESHLVLENKASTLDAQTTCDQAVLSTHARQDVHELRHSSTLSTSTDMTSINPQSMSKMLTSSHNTAPMNNTTAGQSECALSTEQTVRYATQGEIKHTGQDKGTNSSKSLVREHSETSHLRSTNHNALSKDSSGIFVDYSGADYDPVAVGALVPEGRPQAGQSSASGGHAMIGTDKQPRYIAGHLERKDVVGSPEPWVENGALKPSLRPSGYSSTPSGGVENMGFINDEFESTGSSQTMCGIQALEKGGHCTHYSLAVNELDKSSPSQCQLSLPSQALVENKTATAIDLIKKTEHPHELHCPNRLTKIQSNNVDQRAMMEPIQRREEMSEGLESCGSLKAKFREKNDSRGIAKGEAEVPKTPQKAIEVVEMDGTVHIEIIKQEANAPRVEGAVCLMNPRNREQGRRRVELKVALKVGLLFCCFICLWMPLFIAVLVLKGKTGLSMASRTDTVYVTSAIGTCLAAVDPIIYGLSNAQIRTALKTSARKLKRIITGYVGPIRTAACTKRLSDE